MVKQNEELYMEIGPNGRWRWKPDFVEGIIRRKKKGKSATQIAKEFEMTRNQVIGILYRNGHSEKLEERKTREVRKLERAIRDTTRKQKVTGADLIARFEKKQAQLAAKQKSNNWDYVSPPQAKVVVDLSKYDTRSKAPLRVPILDLQKHQCRWPVTDDFPFLFCGQTRADESSYCPHHHELSRRPAMPAKRRA